MTDKRQRVSHETHFHGAVSGPVHTGSGDINIKSFTTGDTIITRQGFMSALGEFKAELVAARQRGLLEKTAEDAIVDVEAAEGEAGKDTPKRESIIKRLENVRDILVAGTGVAKSTEVAAATISRLNSAIESAITIAGNIF